MGSGFSLCDHWSGCGGVWVVMLISINSWRFKKIRVRHGHLGAWLSKSKERMTRMKVRREVKQCLEKHNGKAIQKNSMAVRHVDISAVLLAVE